MNSIELGPTGNLIQGDVLDVSLRPLEELVQHYDPQLYFRWNPSKNHGYGIWELRRRPEKKTVISSVVYKGNTYCTIDYKENEWEHLVWDLPFLDYSLVARLIEGDQWAMSNYDSSRILRLQQYLKKMDETSQLKKQQQLQKVRDEMLYKLKQDKSILNDFKDRIASGLNPAHIMRYWK